MRTKLGAKPLSRGASPARKIANPSSKANAEAAQMTSETGSFFSSLDPSYRLPVLEKSAPQSVSSNALHLTSSVQENFTDLEGFFGETAKHSSPSKPHSSRHAEGKQLQDQILWLELGLCKALVRAVNHLEFITPTPVQAVTIPAFISGFDVCARAVTGSGKTYAFLLPLLHHLLTKPPSFQASLGSHTRKSFVRALVLVPSRELGIQSMSMAKKLLEFTTKINVGYAIGGLTQAAQLAVLQSRPDILVATPGRLVDLLRNPLTGSDEALNISYLEVVVLDECDKLLSAMLKDQVLDIISRVSSVGRQICLFSATMTTEVTDFIKEYLYDPKVIDIGHVALASQLQQQFVRIDESASREKLNQNLDITSEGPSEVPHADSAEPQESGKTSDSHSKDDIIEYHDAKFKTPYLVVLCQHIFTKNVLIFSKYKSTAHRLNKIFRAIGLSSAELHSEQELEKRFESLNAFRNESVNYLFATDLASRGLDLPSIRTVINFDMPSTLTTYIHRVGRTARIGNEGTAVSLVSEYSDSKIMRQILCLSKNINSHVIASVKRRVLPKAALEAAKQEVDAIYPRIREELLEEEMWKQIAESEKVARRLDKREEKPKSMLAEKIAVKPKKTWCISPALKKQREAEFVKKAKEEDEVLQSEMTMELAKLDKAERSGALKRKIARRSVKEKIKAKHEQRVSHEKKRLSLKSKRLAAGAVKKMKVKKAREAIKAKRTEFRINNNRKPYQRTRSRVYKKSRYAKQHKKH